MIKIAHIIKIVCIAAFILVLIFVVLRLVENVLLLRIYIRMYQSESTSSCH